MRSPRFSRLPPRGGGNQNGRGEVGDLTPLYMDWMVSPSMQYSLPEFSDFLMTRTSREIFIYFQHGVGVFPCFQHSETALYGRRRRYIRMPRPSIFQQPPQNGGDDLFAFRIVR